LPPFLAQYDAFGFVTLGRGGGEGGSLLPKLAPPGVPDAVKPLFAGESVAETG